MEFPEGAIVIDQIDGPGDGTDLEDCYFIWFRDSQTYSFFDMSGNEKRSGLKIGSLFMFHLDYFPDFEWALTIDQGSDSFVAGRWAGAHEREPVGDVEPEQSYQATAGGGAEVKQNAASATV